MPSALSRGSKAGTQDGWEGNLPFRDPANDSRHFIRCPLLRRTPAVRVKSR